MTEVIFTPPTTEPVSWSCMYCGNDRPTDIARTEFHGWTCPDCKHIVCSQCLEDIKEVKKHPECTWWSCGGEVAARKSMVREFAKPISAHMEESPSTILTSTNARIEVNVEEKWHPVPDVVNWDMQVNNETMPIRAGPGDVRYVLGHQEVRGEMEVLVTEENIKLLTEAALCRTIIEVGNEDRVIFKGMITGMPAYHIGTHEPITATIELISVDPTVESS